MYDDNYLSRLKSMKESMDIVREQAASEIPQDASQEDIAEILEKRRIEQERQEEAYSLRLEQQRLEKQRRQRELLEAHGMDGYYEYKVLKMHDQVGLFNSGSGTIDASKLANILNNMGQAGWRLVSAYTNELGKNAASIGGFGINSTVDEHIFIFERFVKLPNND